MLVWHLRLRQRSSSHPSQIPVVWLRLVPDSYPILRLKPPRTQDPLLFYWQSFNSNGAFFLPRYFSLLIRYSTLSYFGTQISTPKKNRYSTNGVPENAPCSIFQFCFVISPLCCELFHTRFAECNTRVASPTIPNPFSILQLSPTTTIDRI